METSNVVYFILNLFCNDLGFDILQFDNIIMLKMLWQLFFY